MLAAEARRPTIARRTPVADIVGGPTRRNVTKRAMSPGPPVLAPRPTDDRFQPPNGWRRTMAPVVWRLT